MPKLSISKEIKESLGITDNFMRVSIGLENAKDLIEDLNQALIKAVYNVFLNFIFF
jgi:cystathionine beta-lyase/cystathionine gamma-synthase